METYKFYLDLLNEFIRFKSISTDKKYKSEIDKCADWLINLLSNNSFKTQKIEGYGNPIVVSELTLDPKFETCLIYGHYDVQPADQTDGWEKDPFTVFEKDNRLFARGIVDNKGQVLVHIATVLNLLKQNKLKYNIKFIIEGDEESGSPLIEKFFIDNSEKLKCDFVLISDGELTMGFPSIDVAFRGIVNCELQVTTSQKDNHSGLYGGTIPNSANILAKILANMHDEEGRLTIEGINNSIKVSDDILKNNESIPFYLEEFKKNTGSKVRLDENSVDFYTQVGLLTSAEITTLISGYIGDGFKNAIPGKSISKINFRLSPWHKVQQVKDAFESYIKNNMPEYCEYKIIFDQDSEAIKLDERNDYIKNAKKTLESVYKKESFFRYCGAIVPIAGYFADFLKVPVLDIGLGNEDCNMHGANENYDIETLKKGLEFSQSFLSK